MSASSPIAFTDNPDFNRWLEERNRVEIEAYSFKSSDVLYDMRYDWYLEALERFNTDPEIKRERIISKFPSPIAYYFHQAIYNYQNGSHRLELLKLCFESTIYFLYGLVVAEARHRRLDLNSLGIKWETYWTNLTFQKLVIIENILDYATKSGINFYCAQIINLSTITAMKGLMKNLGQIEGAITETNTQQEDEPAMLFNDLELVLQQLMKLEEVVVFRHKQSESPLYLTCEILNGYTTEITNKTIPLTKENLNEIADDLNSTVVFAQVTDGVFCLAPFVHFYQDASELHASLCFYKETIDSTYQFDVIILDVDDKAELNTSEKAQHKEILELLKRHFSADEIKTLCFNLDIDPDDLPGEGKEGKARELITHCMHRNLLPNLRNEIAEMRPAINLVREPKTPISRRLHMRKSDQNQSQNRVFWQIEHKLKQLVERGYYG